MKPTTLLAIAAVLSAFAEELKSWAGTAPTSATPAPAEDNGTETEAPAPKKRGRPAAAPVAPTEPEAEAPAAPAPVATPAPAAPTGKTYEELRDLIKPLVEEGRGEEVKKVISKYGSSLKEIDAKHHAAFEKDIAALSY